MQKKVDAPKHAFIYSKIRKWSLYYKVIWFFLHVLSTRVYFYLQLCQLWRIFSKEEKKTARKRKRKKQRISNSIQFCRSMLWFSRKCVRCDTLVMRVDRKCSLLFLLLLLRRKVLLMVIPVYIYRTPFRSWTFSSCVFLTVLELNTRFYRSFQIDKWTIIICQEANENVSYTLHIDCVCECVRRFKVKTHNDKISAAQCA